MSARDSWGMTPIGPGDQIIGAGIYTVPSFLVLDDYRAPSEANGAFSSPRISAVEWSRVGKQVLFGPIDGTQAHFADAVSEDAAAQIVRALNRDHGTTS